MRFCSDRELPELLALLKTDISNCFYLYVDIAKYGLSHPNMHVWLERNRSGITAVVMKYFDSMQVYTLPGADMNAIAAQIRMENVPVVTGTAEDCEALKPLLCDDYELSWGWTFEVDRFRPFPSPTPIKLAREEELAECAALICMDDSIGGHYTPAILAHQLVERRREGMGRNYVIHKEGRIIAHIATYAEFKDLAVSGGLIVHPNWRTAPYGTWLESYLFNTLLEEKKRIFSFLRTEKRVKYYKALGITKYWRNGKLVRIAGA